MTCCCCCSLFNKYLYWLIVSLDMAYLLDICLTHFKKFYSNNMCHFLYGKESFLWVCRGFTKGGWRGRSWRCIKNCKGSEFLTPLINKLAGHSFMVVGRRCVASGSGAKNKLLQQEQWPDFQHLCPFPLSQFPQNNSKSAWHITHRADCVTEEDPQVCVTWIIFSVEEA